MTMASTSDESYNVYFHLKLMAGSTNTYRFVEKYRRAEVYYIPTGDEVPNCEFQDPYYIRTFTGEFVIGSDGNGPTNSGFILMPYMYISLLVMLIVSGF